MSKTEMAQLHKISGRLRIKPSPTQTQQQREQTHSRWIQIQLDIFERLVKSDDNENFFDDCIWLTNKRQTLDILVPPAQAARFQLVQQQSLEQQAMKAGFTQLRLSFVAPKVINGLVEMVEEENNGCF
jgi:predicted CopG family antitoxin